MSIEDNIKFVLLVEKYPCLYNPNVKEYSQKHMVDRAWGQVATESNLNIKECKEKWKNIRTVFRRHLPSPSGVPPKNNYYLHNELQFLMPIISSSSSKKSSSKHVHNHSDMEILEVKVEEEEILEEQDPLQNDSLDVDTLQPEVNQFVQTETRKCNDSMDSTFPAETNCHKIKETNLNGSSSSEADEQFLLSLKWDLGEMNSKQKRLFKKGVYDLIDKIMESGS